MTTDRERWQRVSRLFDRAIELEGDARAAFVAAECSGDAALRDELQRMLDADVATSGFDAGVAGAVSLDEPSEPEDASGERLGAWRLLSRVGSGGMGTVYAAQREDGDTAQRAAIKRLQRRWDGSAQAQRFLQERRILAQLSHANIPALLDHGLDDEGRPWFALEFVDGKPLTAWADAQRLNPRERIVLMLQVCAAVQHAHERFVVHRDLKPANILVDAGGRARVLDFGVAKRIDDAAGNTVTGLFAGFTPEYAAPEQIAGRPVSAATDVHALGVMLYELLSGQLPYRFEQADLRSAAEAITDRSAERLDRALITGTPDEVQARIDQRRTSAPAFRRYVRGDLTRIVQTALAKEPERRYSSVQALADDLKRFLDGRPVSVSGDTFGYRARKFVQRNRWGVAMGAVAAMAVVAGMTGFAYKTAEAQREATRAESQARLAKQEETRALEEAKRAQISRDFMASLLGEASPEQNHGKDTTVREVLERAKARIDREFAGQPDLRVEMLSVVASAYSDLSQYDEAQPLLERAVDVADSTPSIAITTRANAHSKYAYTLLAQSEAKKAESEARIAIGLLRKQSPGPLLSEALSILATAQYLQENFAVALHSQQESTDIAGRVSGKQSRAYAESLIELSYFLEATDQPERAVTAAREAYDLLSKQVPDGKDPAVTRALWALGMALTASGREAEAIEPLERARNLVADIYGPRTLKSMRALQLLGSAELGAGRFAAAKIHLSEAMQLIAALAPEHPLGTLIHLNLAEARLRSADALGALREINVLRESLAKNSANAPERGRKASLLQAQALAALGRCDEADAVVEELRKRKIDPAQDDKSPIDGTICAR